MKGEIASREGALIAWNKFTEWTSQIESAKRMHNQVRNLGAQEQTSDLPGDTRRIRLVCLSALELQLNAANEVRVRVFNKHCLFKGIEGAVENLIET